MSRYDTDFIAWLEEQASLLREGRFDELDLDNLIEEIESLGRSERGAIESHLENLLMHLLKWAYQPSYRGRSWRLSIGNSRDQAQKHLRKNPSLNAKVQELADDAYSMAVRRASRETGLGRECFPDVCPWPLLQVMDEDFFPTERR